VADWAFILVNESPEGFWNAFFGLSLKRPRQQADPPESLFDTEDAADMSRRSNRTVTGSNSQPSHGVWFAPQAKVSPKVPQPTPAKNAGEADTTAKPVSANLVSVRPANVPSGGLWFAPETIAAMQAMSKTSTP
jgi:hypothetical protein